MKHTAAQIDEMKVDKNNDDLNNARKWFLRVGNARSVYGLESRAGKKCT